MTRTNHPILQLGDARLRHQSAPVGDGIWTLQKVVPVWRHMEQTLRDVLRRYGRRDYAGLSAIQIGVAIRACVIWTPADGMLRIANPVVRDRATKTTLAMEACLSFFDRHGLVPRPRWAVVSFLDAGFCPQSRRFSGHGARILLHEIDHMDGVLYLDRMRPGDRTVAFDPEATVRAETETRDVS